MKSLKLLLIISLTLISISGAYSQDEDVIKLIEQGITLHDSGEFDQAIEIYNQALELDPGSPLIHYELALSYFSKGDLEKAIEYSDLVLESGDDYLLEAYMTKGSALDNLGRTQESIELFNQAISETDGHYLLSFNLALNYFKIDDLVNAEHYVIDAIYRNINHGSSHLLLAELNHKIEHSQRAILAAHFFLFIEPNTDRSDRGFEILMSNFEGRVKKNAEDSTSTTITIDMDKDDDASGADILLGLLEASKSNESNVDKSEDELFIEHTDLFFSTLEVFGNNDLYKDIYHSFYSDLAKSDHLTTYCKYITQKFNENSQTWLSENEQKLLDFDAWLQKN